MVSGVWFDLIFVRLLVWFMIVSCRCALVGWLFIDLIDGFNSVACIVVIYYVWM